MKKKKNKKRKKKKEEKREGCSALGRNSLSNQIYEGAEPAVTYLRKHF